MYIFFSLYIFYYILVQKNQTTAGLLPDINLPAHHHGKENQTLSLREKPLCRRRAVCAQQVQGRTGTALHWGRPHLPSTVPGQVPEAPCAAAQTNTEKLQPLRLPFSQGTAGPRWDQGAAAASPSTALQSLPTPPAVLAAAAPRPVLRSGPSSMCGSDSGSTGTGGARYLPQLWQRWCSPRE